MKERRRDRIGTLVRDAVADFFLEEVSFPAGVLVSVAYVEVIESGSKANIFVSVFPDTAQEEVAKMLKMSENKASHFVRSRMRSKYTPVVRFMLVDNGSVAKW